MPRARLPLTPAMGILGANTPVGGSPCNASTTFFLWLPPNPTLAGIVLSSQCAAVCSNTSGTVTGTMLSNCLTCVLQ